MLSYQLLIPFLLPLVGLSTANAPAACSISNIPASALVSGPVSIDSSPLTPFHSPKLSAINATAWEYWYWDGVSTDGSAGVTLTFFRDPSLVVEGFPILRVSVDAVWSNGTRFNTDIPIEDSTVTVCGPQTTGVWTAQDIEMTFQATDDAIIEVYMNGASVEGTFTLVSDTRPLYPNGLPYPNPAASVELIPLLNWNEAIPGGFVQTKFVLNGTELSFDGFGGADRNWGSYIWDFVADHWWWVRVQTGPYTLVFWKIVSGIDEKTHTYAHLLEHGIPIVEFSSTDASESQATLTLLYNGTTHGSFEDTSTGFAIDLNLPAGESYHFEVEHVNIVFEAPPSNDEYTRFVNTAMGGKIGAKQFAGVAKSEQNKIVQVIPLSEA